MGKNWLELLQVSGQIEQVLEANAYSEKYGLTLTKEDATLLTQSRKNALKEQRRVEFGNGILDKIIYEFCDSDFIDQNNYVETLSRLQDIFYLYKNEMLDEITDDELLHFMREQFDEVCYGDLDYLQGTCLDIFAQAIRAGYQGHRDSGGYGDFEKMDIVKRWDYELYMDALRELCWK